MEGYNLSLSLSDFSTWNNDYIFKKLESEH